MAQSEEEKLQAELFGELEKNDVKVGGDAAEKMKENIMNANSGQPWLGVGVHEVFIKSIELTQAKTGTLGMKFTVENPEGKNEVTMWLSEGALPYTIENVSRLIVHNQPDDKKAEARNFMANIVSAKELFNVAKQRLVEGQCWLSVKESGDTYKDKDGNDRPSLDRNLLSYKPKQTADQLVSDMKNNSKPVDVTEIPF